MRLINKILATTAIATLGAGAFAQDANVSTDSTLGLDAQVSSGADVKAKNDMGLDSKLGASDTASADTGMDSDMTAEANSDFANLSLEDLTGKSVYDSEDSRVGEVSDVVVDAQGEITEVIIDVGGFLGIGEKPVAVGIDKLDLVEERTAEADGTALIGEGSAGTAMDQTAQTDGSYSDGSATAETDFVVYVRLTEAQLEEMPEYKM